MKTLHALGLVLACAGLPFASAQADVADIGVPYVFVTMSLEQTRGGLPLSGLRFGARLDYTEALKERILDARVGIDGAPQDAVSRTFRKQRLPALLQFDFGPDSPPLLSAQGHDLLAAPAARSNAAGDDSSWFGRNWGLVLSGAGLVALTAVAAAGGGGGSDYGLDFSRSSSSGSTGSSSSNSGSGGAVCATGSTCVVQCPSDGSVTGCKP